jgi:hypothetical protein
MASKQKRGIEFDTETEFSKRKAEAEPGAYMEDDEPVEEYFEAYIAKARGYKWQYGFRLSVEVDMVECCLELIILSVNLTFGVPSFSRRPCYHSLLLSLLTMILSTNFWF